MFYQVYGYNISNGFQEFSPFIDPKLNKIIDFKEGQFTKGIPNGYCKIIDIQDYAYVGFFEKGFAYGKM